MKKEWQLVNEITGRSSNCKEAIKLKINNSICSDDSKIANEFNEYFCSIVSSSTSQIDTVHNNDIVEDLSSTNSFFFENISAIELIKIINSLNNSNSCGIDSISNALLKRIAYNISDVLAYLFNLSVISGVFPSELKSAVVIPLFKKDDRLNKQNYRPISLLPNIAKVFEKAIKSRILNFLIKNSYFSSKQFGFREGISTEDALLDFYTFLHKSLDDKMFCAALFVDITKAFDMVDHEILLKKLYNIGFRGTIFKWLSSYLKDRSQRVKIGDSLSESIKIKFGVPQGSVLGPIFFLIYINSIFSQNLRGRVTAFADDLGLSYNTSTTFQLLCDINYDISIFRNWFAKHKLIISNKTKLMFFNSPTQALPDISYHDPCCKKFNISTHVEFSYNSDISCNSNCFRVEVVDNFKYLGVVIDNKLSWHVHTCLLKSYFRSVVRNFYKLGSMCPPSVLKMFYFGLFHSKLNYGITCWGAAYCNKIKPLLILQKCVIRKIFNVNRRTPSFELFKSLQILPVRHLCYYKILKNFFVQNSFSSRGAIFAYNLRRTEHVNVPYFRTSSYRNSYAIVSCRLFNRLPNFIKIIKEKNPFLRQIKFWLFNYNNIEIETLLQAVV